MSEMLFTIAGNPLPSVMRAELVRDLGDISGSFMIDYVDVSRADLALERLLDAMRTIREGDAVEATIDGTPVLRGWIDDLSLRMDGQQFSASITGRDVTGDLVDCSANPQGPGEYRGLDLLAVATRLCQPFGITVTADTDLGDPFTVVALDPAEPVMETLEKLARQRGVLITSDGIGGLMLTQGGTQRGASPLALPGNVLAMEARLSSRGLYSDVWVKGSFGSLKRPSAATLTSSSVAGQAPATGGTVNSAAEASSILRYGHAINPQVGRYRPRVWVSATQSGGSVGAQDGSNAVEDTSGQSGVSGSAYHGRRRAARRKPMPPRTDASPWTLQDQADWRMRSMRAQSHRLDYVVVDHGVDGVLWRPNTLVALQDDYAGRSGDYLISGLSYLVGEDGPRTRLRLVDPDAFDLEGDEDGTHNGRRKSSHLRASDATSRRYR